MAAVVSIDLQLLVKTIFTGQQLKSCINLIQKQYWKKNKVTVKATDLKYEAELKLTDPGMR